MGSDETGGSTEGSSNEINGARLARTHAEHQTLSLDVTVSDSVQRTVTDPQAVCGQRPIIQTRNKVNDFPSDNSSTGVVKRVENYRRSKNTHLQPPHLCNVFGWNTARNFGRCLPLVGIPFLASKNGNLTISYRTAIKGSYEDNGGRKWIKLVILFDYLEDIQWISSGLLCFLIKLINLNWVNCPNFCYTCKINIKITKI
jgi:hypothetical protein